MSKKILWLSLEYPPHVGGVGRMYERIGRAAPPHRATFWVHDTRPDADQTPTVRRLPLLAASGWPRWRTTFFTLWKHIQPNTNEVIVVGHILPLGIPVWLLSFFKPVQYTVFVHGMDLAQPLLVPRRAWVIQHILRRAHTVFAANNNVAGIAESLGVVKDKIVVVYPPPAVLPATLQKSEARKKLGIEQPKIILLTVGRLVPRKGHQFMLHAFEQVAKHNASLRYVIIGEGPEHKNIEAALLTLTTRDRVQLLGEVSESDLALWFAAADIFMMAPSEPTPGDIEGIGMVFLEAGLFGLPVIATKSGAVAEGVLDGTTGILVAPNDERELINAITRLVTDSALRTQLGAAGKLYVQNNFSSTKAWSAMERAL